MRGPGMFRFAIGVLAIVGAVWLFSSLFGAVGAAAGGAAAAGAFLLVPLFFAFKLLFVLMLFGFFAKAAGMGPRRGPWGRRNWGYRPGDSTSSPSAEPRRDRDEDFEEWHRLAHARDEVDGWVEDL